MSLLEMKGIRKSYYGVEVLHGVDFTLRKGSVHALMGENGAGKSTLVKVIAGIHHCEAGKILIDGSPVTIESPSKAREMGISMIHQELSPVLEMSVAENIFLGREPERMGFLDYKRLYRQTEALL
ncbi:MAG: ATP-binding cassette domain-containing protein, partial [Eubacteriales bacterium]|nr:ATP-binding cassette domain-containing protein [Eubacteriales bacterium]